MSEQQEFSLGPFDGELAARVAEARGHLSGVGQQTLAYLTDNPDGVAFHTAESLGTKAGVSLAVVVRFARKLGCARRVYTDSPSRRCAARADHGRAHVLRTGRSPAPAAE